MNKLPVSPLPTGTVKVGNADVSITSLTREQARAFAANESQQGSETYAIACGVGVSEDEAREWLTKVDFQTGVTLVTEILRLSGLLPPEDAEKAKDPTPGSAATS